MGLFDFLRGKPDEDPILGGRGAEPSGLEVTPVEGTQVWTSSTTTHVDATPSQPGGPPVDPDELMKALQQAGSDPDRLMAELRALFPGAQIDMQQATIDGATHPELGQVMHQFLAGAGQPPLPAGAADPIAQIERLAELHRSGALTDAEFAAAKAKLLGS